MPQIECDVLVIGGGLAGCWAAIKAAEKTRRVVLVEKGKVARSGKSAFSGAGILCPFPGDDLEAWRREIVVRGEYLADQELVEIILDELCARIREMGDWGVEYERDDKGKVVRVSALGSRVTKTVAVSSQQMMETLRRRMLGAGIRVMDRIMVTGLFPVRQSNGRAALGQGPGAGARRGGLPTPAGAGRHEAAGPHG